MVSRFLACLLFLSAFTGCSAVTVHEARIADLGNRLMRHWEAEERKSKPFYLPPPVFRLSDRTRR